MNKMEKYIEQKLSECVMSIEKQNLMKYDCDYILFIWMASTKFKISILS